MIMIHYDNFDYDYDTSKLLPCFLKQLLKTPKKLKEWEIIIKTQSTPSFLDVAKFADFWWKYADVSRTQGLCHVIYIFFGSSLGITVV